MNLVEIKTAVSCACYREVTVVDGVERAAKKRDTTGMMSCGGAVRLGGGQCVSCEMLLIFSHESHKAT
jgi:hypothetical protein